jgi:hypothetical protein
MSESELLKALREIKALLTQPVQTSPPIGEVLALTSRVRILRGDCLHAVSVADAAIAAAIRKES